MRNLLTAFFIVLLLSSVALSKELPKEQVIRAMIGEASSEGYEGMRAIACAIRNRGTLRGVYGLKAKHVDREPKWVWDLARKAYRDSFKEDVTNGGDHWENIKAFGTPYWVKSMKLVAKIGNHNFYKEK